MLSFLGTVPYSAHMFVSPVCKWVDDSSGSLPSPPTLEVLTWYNSHLPSLIFCVSRPDRAQCSLERQEISVPGGVPHQWWGWGVDGGVKVCASCPSAGPSEGHLWNRTPVACMAFFDLFPVSFPHSFIVPSRITSPINYLHPKTCTSQKLLLGEPKPRGRRST